MAILVSAEAARDTRRAIVSNGVGAHLTTFIGSNRYMADAAPPPGPEAGARCRHRPLVTATTCA